MLKRFFDFIFALVLVFLLSPVLLLISVLTSFVLGIPFVFVQQRTGFKGNSFNLYKFRSMSNSLDQFGNLLPDSERLGPYGRFLRSTSLDELPSLFNILKGEMSFVGPRPLLPEYLPLYSSEQSRRHDVKPGLTGWAQVNGRNAISWEDKFQLDTWYVDNRSFWLDLKIILLTFKKVLVRDGISAEGEVTMQKFTGSPRD